MCNRVKEVLASVSCDQSSFCKLLRSKENHLLELIKATYRRTICMRTTARYCHLHLCLHNSPESSNVCAHQTLLPR